jgi:predicted O-linked N-acetylglucosamine transferase (SPINDLY family)
MADDLLMAGNDHLGRGDYTGAIDCYRRVLRIEPLSAEAVYNCGVALHKKGELDQAIAQYTRAIDLRPELVSAYFNLAHALAELERFEGAEAAYRQVIELQPDNAQAAYNLGLLYQSAGSYPRALACFQQALQIRPDYAEALNNIGVIWRDQEQLGQAQICFEQALAIKPGMAAAHFNLGIIEQKFGDWDQAVALYHRAMELDPGYVPPRWLYLLSLPMFYRHESQINAVRERFSANLATLIRATAVDSPQTRRQALEGLAVTANFYLQYQGRDDRELQEQYGRLAVAVMAANYPRWSGKKPMVPRVPGEKIRVGYASSCMYGHTIGIFLLGWLDQPDRETFEYFCYHIGDRRDALTEAIQRTADHFHHFPKQVAAAATQIEKDRLHILIHTDIGMNPATVQLAALRLAPVQCKGWGHPVTTGLPTIDYYLSSDLMETADAQKYYSEQLIRLPHLALNYTPPPVPARPKTRRDFGIPEEAIIYLSTQSLFKYLPQHDDLYPRIAAQVPQALFVFLAHGHEKVTARFAARLAKAFEKSGRPFCCLFIPFLKHQDFLSLNLAADVLLDTLQWSGGKTTLEALVCDLPVVTLPGDFLRGRHAYAFLTRMGLRETIAVGKDDYVRLAVRLGLEPDFRAKIKAQIQEKKVLLFHDRSVNTALEAFFKSVCPAAPAGDKKGGLCP